MVRCSPVFRTLILAFTALLAFAPDIFSSPASEAARMYSTASERLSDVKKSSKKKKYRSYWIDCVRLFELIEKKYPDSPSASDSCYARASLYQDLYQVSRSRRDIADAASVYAECQKTHPRHEKAPESLFRMIEISLDHRKNTKSAVETYRKLADQYPSSAWTTRARARLGLPDPARKAPQEIRTATRTAPSSGVTVSNIRYWSGGAHTRVVIDMDGSFTFEAHQLKEPDRLFFDLKTTRLSDSVNREPLPIHDGILKQIRSSQYDPATVRVVLDLASLTSYAAFPLREPDRLVIDITGQPGENGIAQIPSGGQAVEGAGSGPDASANREEEAVPGSKMTLSRQINLKVKTVAIDAGHGGHDPGAIGKYGLKEKEVTLDVAKRLASLVKEKLDCNVILTRDKDVFIPLDERPAIAKTRGADLFVSIHVNAHRRRSARGIETYIQSLQASDRDAMETAARENATSTKRLSELGDEIERILADLKKDNKIEESLQLAHAVQASLVSSVKPVQREVMDLGVKRAFFYVLMNTEMPSILAEVGFISNPDEEKLLKTSAYRQRIAEALFEGISKYIDAMSPKMAMTW